MSRFYLLIFLLIICPSISFAEGNSEVEHPWSSEITKKAKDAIFFSIDNLSKPIEESDSLFPEGRTSLDFYFPYIDSIDFKVVGYSNPEGSSVYTIHFHGLEFLGFGSRIAVEIDIKTETVFRVYVLADA